MVGLADAWFWAYFITRVLLTPRTYPLSYVRRIAAATDLPIDSLPADLPLPMIDIVVVAAGKDVDMLPKVLRYGGNASRNAVRRAILVVPHHELHHVSNSLRQAGSDYDFDVEVRCEDDVVSPSTRNAIHQVPAVRYGWILQQALKLQTVVSSEAPGCLVIDADTLLLRPRTWLTADGRQVLTPTFEFQEPYYRFLSELGVLRWPPKRSFTSHHMLMQPSVLRSVLNRASLESVEAWVHAYLRHQSYGGARDYLNDYELYAQGLMNLEPGRVHLEKWSNVGVARSAAALSDDSLHGLAKSHCSVSMHSYLQEPE